jgi:transcriptional regulator with XRE-family HTH domain
MYLADRLRDFREAKSLSQGDIEKRTGLLRCYISRVENGHTIPALETLEKIARAYEVPLYQLFYDGDNRPPTQVARAGANGEADWASNGKGARMFTKIRRAVSRLTTEDRELILFLAQKIVSRKRSKSSHHSS